VEQDIKQTKKRDQTSFWGFSIVFLSWSFLLLSMFPAAMSNSTSLSEEASVSSGTRVQDFGGLNPIVSTISPQTQPPKVKKKRSLPGNPGRTFFYLSYKLMLSVRLV